VHGKRFWTEYCNYRQSKLVYLWELPNDETLIAIENPTIAAHYEREFSRLYKTAVVGLESLPHAQKLVNVLVPQPTTPTDWNLRLKRKNSLEPKFSVNFRLETKQS